MFPKPREANFISAVSILIFYFNTKPEQPASQLSLFSSTTFTLLYIVFGRIRCDKYRKKLATMTKFTTIEDETIGCTDLQCENRSQISQNLADNGAAGATPLPSTRDSTDNSENINENGGNPYGFECEGVTLPGKSNETHLEGATNILLDGTTENNTTLSPPTSEDSAGDNAGAMQTNVSLEDYKCPICLDIFINTVKVDCCYGHKFCNFCIQCWINFERHLVTECPVCRGPIFGKSLDLKTDAEIRAIFDSLTEDEKKARLLAIKERLQLEYPNSNIQQIVNGLEVPMRISNNSNHNFNHDLNIPIPLIGFVPGEPAQFVSSYLQDNDFPQNIGDRMNDQLIWSPEMYHPANWEDYGAQDFQNINEVQQLYQSQRGDLDHSNIRHQHYRHQNQENSLWDNNLYVTPVVEDTSRPLNRMGSPSSVSPTESPFINQINANHRQNQFHEMPSGALGGYLSARLIQQQPQRIVPQEHAYNINPVGGPSPPSPRNVSQHNRIPQQFVTQPPQTPAPFHQQPPSSQPTPTNPFNGFYCCYIPTCPNNNYVTQQPAHYTPTPSTYLPIQVQQGSNSHHQGFSNNNGYHCTRQTQQCHYTTSTTNPVQVNFWNACSGNLSAASYYPPRIRPNMPGASSMPLQLPTPNNAPSPQSSVSQVSPPDFNSRLIVTPSPIHFQANSGGMPNNGQRARNVVNSRSRTPVSSNTARVSASTENRGRQSVQVSSCPVVRSNNNRAQFAGGFSLFSAGGHVNFQISHTPKTMMVGDRQMTMPPGRLTHPLVSLVPMSHDGSSTRVSLTFEVHRV